MYLFVSIQLMTSWHLNTPLSLSWSSGIHSWPPFLQKQKKNVERISQGFSLYCFCLLIIITCQPVSELQICHKFQRLCKNLSIKSLIFSDPTEGNRNISGRTLQYIIICR